MNRRVFLRKNALGLWLLPWVLASGEVGQEPWLGILETARWCPSPHNTQPWKLRIIQDNKALLFYDPNRLLPVTDPDFRFMRSAFGMFLTAMRIAAADKGYLLTYDLTANANMNADGNTPVELATLQLEKQNISGIIPAEWLLKRRTSRMPYQGEPLSDETLQNSGKVWDQSEHGLHFSKDQPLIKKILELNQVVLFEDLDDTPSRQEIQKWIRTTTAAAQQYQDGLWNRCMGFPGRLMHRFFYHHERFQAPLKRELYGRKYIRSMGGTDQLGWIYGPFESPADQIKAGELLMEYWLRCSMQNLYLHPLGSLITNKTAFTQLQSILPGLPTNAKPWFIFRIGRSKTPERSLRLDVQKLILP